MAVQFYDEVQFFLATIFFGAAAALCYDVLRIGRRIWKRSLFLVSVQDFCFWFMLGVLAFRLIYLFNEGILRFYAFGGMCIGACLYVWTLGRFFVRFGLKIALFFINPFQKGLQFVKKEVKLKIRRLPKRKRREDAHETGKKEKKDRNLSSDSGSVGIVSSSQKRKREKSYPGARADGAEEEFSDTDFRGRRKT